MDNMIRVINVTKKFRKMTILDDVSLEIPKGKICGLVGHNGSGKTVLMKIICGFVTPDSGEVWVGGNRIGRDCDFPDDIGVIIENPGFSPYLSGFKNLKSLASIRRRIDDEQIRQAMLLVGLDPDDKKWVSKYSLGMRQRLGIAQAFMENQAVLVLDEPMNGLDTDSVEQVREILLELKKAGKTIVIASHNKEDIEVLCDEVFEMKRGCLTMVHSMK